VEGRPLKPQSVSRAGKAIVWQTIQYGGEKVIFLVRLLILAKLLTPDDFGLLAIASVAIDFLLRISNFGMVPALVQREDVVEEHFDAAWTVGVLRALIITIIVFISAPMIAEFFAEPRATNILRVLALRPLISASASIMVIRFTRKLDFRALAMMQLPRAFFNAAVSIALAPWLGVWALVAGNLAGPIVYLFLSYILAPHKPRFSFQFGAIQSLAKFGRWVFWTSIIVMGGQSILRLVISRQLGAAELGLYYLAASLAFLPTDIASQIVGEVAFPFYSRLQQDLRQATQAFKTILTSLAVLLLPMSALFISLAPSLVKNVLDERWAGSIRIIQVLALASIIDMLGETISPILNGTGHPDKVLLMESVQSLMMIAMVWSLTNSFGLVGAAMAWIPSVFMSQLVGLFYLRKILQKPFTHLWKPLGTVGLVSIFGGMAAYAVDFIVPGLLGFIMAAVLAVAGMGGMLLYLERKYALGLTGGFSQAFPQIAAYLKLEQQVI
jgi:O-antigen/teichoic acid export membrane protein